MKCFSYSVTGNVLLPSSSSPTFLMLKFKQGSCCIYIGRPKYYHPVSIFCWSGSLELTSHKEKTLHSVYFFSSKIKFMNCTGTKKTERSKHCSPSRVFAFVLFQISTNALLPFAEEDRCVRIKSDLTCVLARKDISGMVLCAWASNWKTSTLICRIVHKSMSPLPQ